MRDKLPMQTILDGMFGCDSEFLGEDMIFYLTSRVNENIRKLEEMEREIDELLKE